MRLCLFSPEQTGVEIRGANQVCAQTGVEIRGTKQVWRLEEPMGLVLKQVWRLEEEPMGLVKWAGPK